MPHTEIADITDEMSLGYELVESFRGKTVRVFLCSGSVLSGDITQIKGKHILIENTSNRTAMINLDHVASITRM